MEWSWRPVNQTFRLGRLGAWQHRILGSIGGNAYIVLSQEAGAKLQVIIEVEGASSLESRAESRHRRGFGELPHALHPPELTLSVLRGHLGTPSRTPTVVVVGGGHVGGCAVVRVLLVLLLAVEEGRHVDTGSIRSERGKRKKETVYIVSGGDKQGPARWNPSWNTQGDCTQGMGRMRETRGRMEWR